MVFVLFAIITPACYQVGFRIGRWWQDREPGEQEGPTVANASTASASSGVTARI